MGISGADVLQFAIGEKRRRDVVKSTEKKTKRAAAVVRQREDLSDRKSAKDEVKDRLSRVSRRLTRPNRNRLEGEPITASRRLST